MSKPAARAGRRVLVALSFTVYMPFSVGFADPIKDQRTTLRSRAIPWGIELNLENEETLRALFDLGDAQRNELMRVYLEKFASLVKKSCPECTVEAHDERYGGARPVYTVTYPDGFWFQFFQDPGVIEFTARKSTISDLRSREEVLERDIYRNAAQLELSASVPNSLGHLNMAVKEAFGGDVKLFGRFIADLSNHPELALGLLYEDPNNAPPLASLDAEQRKAFALFLEEIEQGKYRSIKEAAAALQKNVYYKTFTSLPVFTESPEKFQALNVTSIVRSDDEDSWRIELRFLRNQASVKEILLLTELFEARLKFVASQNDPIAFAYANTAGPLLMDSVPLEEQVRLFARFIEEVGLKFEDYIGFLPEKYAFCIPSIVEDVQRGRLGIGRGDAACEGLRQRFDEARIRPRQ